MKKFLLIVFCAMILPLSACKFDVKSDVIDNLSDVRYCVFAGQNENVSATLVCGMREKVYSYDGIANKMVEFGIITLTFKKQNKVDNATFELRVGQNQISGTLEENPYDHTLMADIEKIVDEKENVVLIVEGLTQNMQLVCESVNWKIQYDKAIEIAYNHFENAFADYYHKHKFLAECQLKIVMDQTNVNEPYYWCFMLIGQNGISKSIIFDVNDGKILTNN